MPAPLGTDDADAVGVGEAGRDSPPSRVLNVGVHATHIADAQVVETVAIPGRAAIVDHEHRQATRREKLDDGVEAGVVPGVWTAVNQQGERRLSRGPWPLAPGPWPAAAASREARGAREVCGQTFTWARVGLGLGLGVRGER